MNRKKNINDYWVVEFNEGNNEYAGRIVDKNLIDEIKRKDQFIKDFNNSLLDEYGDLKEENYDKYLGFYKFYFEHIVNGEIKEQLRIDIGDGNLINEKEFDLLYKAIKQ